MLLPSPGGSAQGLQSVLKAFPAVRYAFAYGSAVFSQPGLYEQQQQQQQPQQPSAAGGGSAAHAGLRSGGSGVGGGGPMLDFIFAVDDPHAWHQQNIARNASHYSWLLSKLGSDAVCTIADHVGVGVHFNTLVPWESRLIKYGVTGVEALRDDLRSWRHLYLAGRLQKAVSELGPAAPPGLAEDLAANVAAAAGAALLLLPPRFTTRELLGTVVGLSYHGDIRMAFAEDPRKVLRIVDGSWDSLKAMYEPQLSQQATPGKLACVEQLGDGVWRQGGGEGSRAALTDQLPLGVLHEMARRSGFPSLPESHLLRGSGTREEVLAAVAAAAHSGGDGGAGAAGQQQQRLLARSLAAIVRRSSGYQALSGLLSVGPGKQLRYVGQKLSKAWKSR